MIQALLMKYWSQTNIHEVVELLFAFDRPGDIIYYECWIELSTGEFDCEIIPDGVLQDNIRQVLLRFFLF